MAPYEATLSKQVLAEFEKAINDNDRLAFNAARVKWYGAELPKWLKEEIFVELEHQYDQLILDDDESDQSGQSQGPAKRQKRSA